MGEGREEPAAKVLVKSKRALSQKTGGAVGQWNPNPKHVRCNCLAFGESLAKRDGDEKMVRWMSVRRI